MSNALALVAQNTGASQEEIKEVLSGMIVSAKNQHGSVATNAELAIVTGVAAKYDLNPLVKEMAAFVSGGKLQVTVMIDGWYKMVNRQPTFDGVEFDDHMDANGKLTAITCRMYLTNRTRPVTVTEYLAECRKTGNGADVWNKWPSRMLRHKAYIQAARMAFGISEIVDPDEADRIKESDPAQSRDITPEKPAFDIESISADLDECGDLSTLDKVCGDIRQKLEASGLWDNNKVQLSNMKQHHKDRINSYSEVEEAEFEEYQPDTDQKPAESELEDIAFEDDDEEF
ncbi:RecT family protein [Vibrio phage 1.201.B._10N.286.55.F1]|nr:RecT family protein [Vibrio phage 1.201.B._10N.286.55.F1]